MSQYRELNLDECVEAWAIDAKDSEGDDILIKKDYSRIKFIDDPPEFDVKRQHTSGGHPLSSQILYEETYKNATDRQQMFSLKLTRETTSVGHIDLKNALVMDGHTRLRMRNLPPGVPVTAGFGSEINFQDIGSHKMKQSLTWSVDTQVKVSRQSTVKATVSVTEHNHEAHFRIKTRIRGNMHCDIVDKYTGSDLEVVEGDINEILKEYGDIDRGLTFERNRAVFESSGYCSFRFGIEKHVSLDEMEGDHEYEY